MPWNPFKTKKSKAGRSEPIRSGFHPIDIDALAGVTGVTGDDADAGRARGTDANEPDVTSPALSDNSVDEPPLRDYPDYGRDGLLSAAFTGDTTVMKLMLALGPEAKLHKYDSLGNTPLHLAAFSGHQATVKALLDTPSRWHDLSDGTSSEAGSVVPVDVNARNGEDDTPLYMAVLCNNLDIVSMLAEACGRKVNLSNVEGFTPLHYAAGEGNLSVTKYLVEVCGAETEAMDKLGLTPAFCAVLQGRADVAEYLLKRNPHAVKTLNSSQDTMLHCALKGLESDPDTMSAIVDLLIDVGAPVDTPGGPPECATARQLLCNSAYADRFQLPPAPVGEEAEGSSVRDGEDGGKPGCREEGREREAQVEGDDWDKEVKLLRAEAGQAAFFKAYLCAVSDVLDSPAAHGGMPPQPALPLEFVQGKPVACR